VDAQGIATFVSLGALALAAIFAGFQVRELRLTREAQARPWVIVRFDMGWAIKIVIENIGPAVATDVHVTFVPELESSMEGPRDIQRAPALRDGIPMLPPGERMSFFLDSSIARLAEETTLPKVYRATLGYKDARHERTFDNETYVLDIEAYRETLIEQDAVSKIADSLVKIEKGFTALDKAVKSVAAEIHSKKP
jgi:hypothetical protein